MREMYEGPRYGKSRDERALPARESLVGSDIIYRLGQDTVERIAKISDDPVQALEDTGEIELNISIAARKKLGLDKEEA